jgi:hypothetical protein
VNCKAPSRKVEYVNASGVALDAITLKKPTPKMTETDDASIDPQWFLLARR